jgi:hypothetical protein
VVGGRLLDVGVMVTHGLGVSTSVRAPVGPVGAANAVTAMTPTTMSRASEPAESNRLTRTDRTPTRSTLQRIHRSMQISSIKLADADSRRILSERTVPSRSGVLDYRTPATC